VTLREILAGASNDYSQLEERYRAATVSELVSKPFTSFEVDVPLHRSASVLIGTYNSRDTLSRSLDSIANSSLNLRRPDLLEVVVVDDGSTDGTWEMLGQLPVDLRLRCVRQERAGLTRAHNTGLALASGDIVIFSDSDIVHTPYALEELLKRHEILPQVTLLGFRFDVERDSVLGPWQLVPTFWGDFRLNFPGVPNGICRETGNLKELGNARRLAMANGAGYDLTSTVVGAFFSIERNVLLTMGGSEERLHGWGCEDSLIGAASIALGNKVVPVFSAASAHVMHERRDPGENSDFARNIRTANDILDGEFDPPGSAPLDAYLSRALARFEREPSGNAGEVRPPVDYPLAPNDHSGWGLCAWSVGSYTEAADAYRRAANDDPASPWPLVGQAKSLRELGRLDDAQLLFEEARRRDPGNAWVAWDSGLNYSAQGEYARARAAFERASAFATGLFEAEWALRMPAADHKHRGNQHAEQGLHRVALRDFELSLVVDANLPWTHYDRGLSLRALSRGEEALSAVLRADELLDPADNNRTWLHKTLAELYLERDQHVLSKLQIERALRLLPENEAAAVIAERLSEAAETRAGLVCTMPLLRRIADIPGWLTAGEADLLSAATVSIAPLATASRAGILELGSFCGRSTVAIAHTLRALNQRIPFTAVDPHAGYDFGEIPDTYDAFIANLRQNELDGWVSVVRGVSHELDWDKPLALLFIDAMHDYRSVLRDYSLFSRFVVPGGLIAFHDYFDLCPGVVQCVDEVLSSGSVLLAAHRERLILLQRPPAGVLEARAGAQTLTAR
jgi:tetratricopeptide (TPR) repeat protein